MEKVSLIICVTQHTPSVPLVLDLLSKLVTNLFFGSCVGASGLGVDTEFLAG